MCRAAIVLIVADCCPVGTSAAPASAAETNASWALAWSVSPLPAALSTIGSWFAGIEKRPL